MQTEISSARTRIQKAFQAKGTYLLLAIFGIALWLRLWGIGFGLPHDFMYDEIHEIVRAMKLGAGEYYWNSFGKGGLYYLLFIEYGLLYVLWRIMGWVSSSNEFAFLYLQDPTIFYLAGRLTVALMGALTCLVIFRIGKRLYDWRVGLGAAFIGATAYQHGVHSHIINVDIGMTLGLWTSILFYLEYEKNRERRWLISAGILAGLTVAFKLPGAIVILPLVLAIGSKAGEWRNMRLISKEAGIILLTALLTFTLVAPEWTTNVASLYRTYFRLKGTAPADTPGDIENAVDLVTVVRTGGWSGYFRILASNHNLALSVTAILGASLGLLRKYRWDIIWAVLILTFLLVMTAAPDHKQPERYLLPIMPGLWLLSSRAIAALCGRRWLLSACGLAVVILLPLVELVRQDYEWTRPDTRQLAKEWIEANVHSGARILMDGMQYRFVVSPPLNPDQFTVSRQIEQARPKRLSRGVSGRALALYAESTKRAKGPTYELHSTVWGLSVEEPDYYVRSRFDYIITSSYVTERYTRDIHRNRFPKSARFYKQLNTDSRFQKVYSVDPVGWERSGPSISVYKVAPSCNPSSPRILSSSSPQDCRQEMTGRGRHLATEADWRKIET